MRDNYQDPIAKDVEGFGKVRTEKSHVQSKMHSDFDSAESIADSDLEDGDFQKMLTSPLHVQDREDRRSFRISTAPVKLAAMIQERERGVTAKRTQADRREGLMSNSSQETRASGKPAAIFSSGIEEPGNLIKSSIFKNADPSNLWKSLLEGNENHLLSQAISDLMKQELQVESLNNCVSELQQQAFAQRLEVQDSQHGDVESRREQDRLQEELSMKEKVLRYTQIRSMHEMGEMKRAQERLTI